MREHVALYTSFLGHSAVKRYSEFLASLPLDMQHHELKQALLRAEKYHLDIKCVAEETARAVSQAALAVRSCIHSYPTAVSRSTFAASSLRPSPTRSSGG
jgi:hypothetical protein